jgi:general secretion pathway protein G
MTMTTARSAPGFTLIELIITVAIIGLLASIAVPTVELVAQRNKEQELRWALREIRKAIDAYKQAYEDGHMIRIVGDSGYPPTLNVLVDGVVDALNADQHKIYFLRRIPPDPMAAGSNLAPEKTWGLRSYESDFDSPSEGNDVFDVYSQAPGTGINGVPYRQW